MNEETIELLNARFQEKLYELIDSKANGLKDCTVTEIVDVAAAVIQEVSEHGRSSR